MKNIKENIIIDRKDLNDAANLIDIDDLRRSVSHQINRRDFLKISSLACGALYATSAAASMGDISDFPADTQRYIIEARFYEKLPYKKIRCKLCPRECVIDDRERGYCGVRENREGTYYSLVHSRPCTYHVDPIEKKPLFHFYPGSQAFSIATAGCNVNCKFCQNWEISQVRPEQVQSIYLPPAKVARSAKDSHCLSIAYTYNEPTIFFEYMEDTAIAGRKMGVKSVVISAGYIAEEPLAQLCQSVDAIKIDLKAFSETYYKDIVNGELKPVLNSLETILKHDMWTEIVYLVVPTLNDSDQELTALSKWVKTNLGADVPVHFTRFHPYYLIKNLPPTPVKTLDRAWEIAHAEGLNYVYVGNVPGHPAENTKCPKCGQTVVTRNGFFIGNINIKDGRCANCSYEIAGKWGQ
jgi:pyruvate formate lyase activating enzyme